ncbi:MAG TPA: DNA-3-methyladenine glycosylase [Candidatus Limnocylindria bacterium]|nr:DNA-3-methyladenine glycosylase [Candidatus Limnocylindria bacterium]
MATPLAARRLLGWRIVSRDAEGECRGRIVETEAYGGPDDRASHARAGLTRRTAPMFGAPGLAYVYLVYGMHECLNVVAHEEGGAGAVLLRAAEPLDGGELMRRRRGRAGSVPALLASGPARLCRALGVDRSLSGHDLLAGARLWLEPPPAGAEAADEQVASGPRVGVAYAGPDWAERPWRFWLSGHPAVSRR